MFGSTPQQYQSLIAYINERKANKGFWNAFLANCVTFGRDVASFLKVKMPPLLAVAPSVVMYPKDVVEWLRDANGGDKDQGPLKDAPGGLPAEVVAKLHGKAPFRRPMPAPPAASTEEKPAAPKKKRVANKPDESAEASAIH